MLKNKDKSIFKMYIGFCDVYFKQRALKPKLLCLNGDSLLELSLHSWPTRHVTWLINWISQPRVLIWKVAASSWISCSLLEASECLRMICGLDNQCVCVRKRERTQTWPALQTGQSALLGSAQTWPQPESFFICGREVKSDWATEMLHRGE